jgi:hypothetical protein
MNRMYALLIGIDCYMENTGLAGLDFGSLGGCVRDINMVEAYLKTLPEKPERILKLTASGAGPVPAETDKSLWPIYQNIVQAFKEVTALASERDLIYIHYSGHGVRAATAYPAIKGAGYYWDEGIVPTDYGQPGGNYLLDLPIAYLIQEMLKKQLRVTIVFDSCHSGGATRGAGSAMARGVPGKDLTPPKPDSLVATPEQLNKIWAELTQGGTRSATSTSGWMVEPKGYTLLAACLANELAYEDYFEPNGGTKNGALTYWLLDSLRTLGTGVSYKRLHDRLLAKIRGWKEAQTPQLQGEGDLIVFGESRALSHFAIPVLNYDATARTVTLNAGEAHGLSVGSQLAIYPSADSDLTSKEGRLALVEVTELRAESDCIAKIVEPTDPVTIDAGNQAMLLGTSNLRLQRTVRIARNDLSGYQEIESAIQNFGGGFIRIAGDEEKVDFQVDISQQEDAYELLDGGGSLLPIKQPIMIGAADAAERIAKRLVHIAKFRNVQILDNPNSSFANKLRIEIIGATPDPSGRGLTVQPDQKITLRISNDLKRDPLVPDDKKNTFNITILDLQSNWEISQLFPTENTASDIISPEDSLSIELEMGLPEGYEEFTDAFKVFATQKTTNFQWLTLPTLDEAAKPKGGARGISTDPLDQLLEAISEEQLTTETLTRAAKVVEPANQSKPWIVAEVKLCVKKV